jgi:hypothetical protein
MVWVRMGGLVGARVAIAEDGFPAFLVAALEVLFRDRLFVGEDAIDVLLGRLGTREHDDLCDALELFRDECGMGTAARSQPNGFGLDVIE